MTPDLWKKARRILIEALKKRPDAVPAFLDEACAGNETLRVTVDSLLESHPETTTVTAHPDQRTNDTWLPQQDPDLVDHRVGEYYVQSLIDAGGMGVVYKARKDQLNLTVALKTMKPGFDVKLFEIEWQTLASLQHPGIVQIFDVGEHQHESGIIHYFTMEYISGARHLTQHADEYELTIQKRLELFADVCDAVAAAHHKGIIHLDLKPSNILVKLLNERRDQPKIIDFGVASVARFGPLRTAYCTRDYSSPEQLSGDPEDLEQHSDVYSLGVILFELLCGSLPHAAGADGRVGTKPKRASVVNPDVPARIDDIITKAMQKRPNRRFHNAADLADAVLLYLDEGKTNTRSAQSERFEDRVHSNGPRSLRRVAMVVALLGVLALGVYIPPWIWPEIPNGPPDDTGPPPLIALVDVRIKVQWWLNHKPVSQPDRPVAGNNFEVTLSAPESGDLLIFEVGRDGAEPFTCRDYKGYCEPFRYETTGPGLRIPVSFRVSSRQRGLNMVVAVLVSSSSDDVCRRIAESLGPAVTQTADPAWPDGRQTTEIDTAIEKALRSHSVVRGFGVFPYPVMGN